MDNAMFKPFMPVVTGVAVLGADGRAKQLYVGEVLYVRADCISQSMVTPIEERPVEERER